MALGLDVLLFLDLIGTSVKSYKIMAISSFISCFTSVLISLHISFYNFLDLHSTLSEKDFRYKFSFLNEFTQPTHNDQNLLSVAKGFINFF